MNASFKFRCLFVVGDDLTGVLHRVIALVVTTTFITLSSNKIQNGDILILANPPGKLASKMNRQRERESEREFQICMQNIGYILIY